MTQEQFAVRRQRAEREVFVITAAEEGWRVRSARNPSRFYLVSDGGPNGPQCSCPDYTEHVRQDSTWRCKHVLAVLNHRARAAATDPQRGACAGEGCNPSRRPFGGSNLAKLLSAIAPAAGQR